MNNITRQRPIISDQVAEAAASDNLVPPLAWLACSWTPNHPRPFCLIGFVSEKKHFARLPTSLSLSADVSIPIHSEVHIGILNYY